MSQRARNSFSTALPGGGERFITRGQIVDNDDPILKGRVDWFDEVPDQPPASPAERVFVAGDADSVAFTEAPPEKRPRWDDPETHYDPRTGTTVEPVTGADAEEPKGDPAGQDPGTGSTEPGAGDPGDPGEQADTEGDQKQGQGQPPAAPSAETRPPAKKAVAKKTAAKKTASTPAKKTAAKKLP